MPATSTDTPVCRFGSRILMGYLGFLSAFGPLSIDLYLPALPKMTEVFMAPVEIVTLTLSAYMLFLALSTLAWGPLSDTYGRKPILRIGLALYFFASVLCVFSSTIYWFIGGRIIQACGGGAISSVCLAIVKDCFKGKRMGSALAWLQTITMLAPMIAPVLGAFLLEVFSWRGVFVVLASGGGIGLLGSGMLRESIVEKFSGSPFRTLGRVGYVLSQKRFSSLLLIFSIMSMPFMTFLASSSFIYMNQFHLSAQAYSYFFLFNAIVCMSAPFSYMRFFHKLSPEKFMNIFLGIMIVASLFLFFWGSASPFAFAFLFAPITFGGMILKPFGTVLMMDQLDTDTGTLSSLIVCFGLLCASLSIFLCSLNWLDFISRSAAIAGGISAIALLLWVFFVHLKLFKMPGRHR